MENSALKTEIEDLLDGVLIDLAAQRAPTPLWQLNCFLDSLDDCRRGYYRTAWNRTLDVVADDVSEHAFPNNAASARELSGISLEMLRAGLMGIKVLPVSEVTDSGRMDNISDWVRMQSKRFGSVGPLSS
jgi:hypothetical protein